MAKKKPKKEFDPLDVDSLGKGAKIISIKDVPLTPAFAREFLEDRKEFIGERKLREGHVEYLATEMARRTFLFELVNLAEADLNGEIIRLNGQHTSRARLEHEDDKSFSLPVRLIRYKVATENDLRNLYSKFDRHGIRTQNDLRIAQLRDFELWKGIGNGAIRWTSAGYPLYKWEDPKERKSHDIRERLLLLQTKDMELGVKVAKFITDYALGNGCDYLRRSSTVAALFGTIAKHPSEAYAWWQSIAEGVFERSSDPGNKLRNELMVCVIGKESRTNKRTLNHEQALRMCIKAWNAHITKDPRGVNLRSGIKVMGPRPKFK